LDGKKIGQLCGAVGPVEIDFGEIIAAG